MRTIAKALVIALVAATAGLVGFAGPASAAASGYLDCGSSPGTVTLTYSGSFPDPNSTAEVQFGHNNGQGFVYEAVDYHYPNSSGYFSFTDVHGPYPLGTGIEVLVRILNSFGLQAEDRYTCLIPSLPGPPTSVVAIGRNRSADVSWTAPSNDGGSSIYNYVIEATANNGASWMGDEPNEGPSSGVFFGLKAGVAYRFRVAAQNDAGQGPWSEMSAPVNPYGVTFTGNVHGCVCVHGTARVGASAPRGSRMVYSWKVGTVWTSTHTSSRTFAWADYRKSVVVKIVVITPDGRGYSKYYSGGEVAGAK